MLTGASGQVVVTPGMVQQAKAMGASDAQINAAMHATSPSSSQSSRADTSADTGGNEVRREASADQRQASEDKTAVQRRSVDSLTRNTVFGQEIFSTKNLTFAPSYNMATPPSYVLGPGDEVIIEVWGEAESRVQEKISPEGSISIQGVGPINLAGLTVAEAQKRVESRIHEIMNGQVKVSLGQIRSIKVNISGEVVTPGTYTLPSLATLFNAIYSADTPTNVLPSMHVVGCMAVLAVTFDSKYLKKVRIPAVIIAAAICAATVFVKQHSILDVFAALALSLVLYLIIYVAARRIVDRRQPTATA